MKIKDLVFSFSKPTVTSIVASNRIARFLADQLDCPLVWDKSIADYEADTLYLVNGAFVFCSVLPELAKACLAAKRIVWVQNDYTIGPIPKATSNGLSPFRAAFRQRHERGQRPMDFWTTVEKMSDVTKGSAYVNWNALTFDPFHIRQTCKGADDLFYYRAYRLGRVPYFSRYFDTSLYPVTVASRNKKFQELLPNLALADALPEATILQEINGHGLGLYIEDEKSHKEFHSPANRFYEMLSAKLPMVFQPESAPMLKKAGIDVTPFIVRDAEDVAAMMKDRSEIYKAQGKWRKRDFLGELLEQLAHARSTP